jgi:diguanylate cyclase (GGDEF)-like protein
VALFDLDGFKAVNDTLGHAAGDGLLFEVARRARECVRESDTLGRLGGDEFLAILPEAGREGALHVAEKIRVALAAPYSISGKPVSISASLGIALYPEHGEDADALFRAADAALYGAKHAGRNCTQFAP